MKRTLTESERARADERKARFRQLAKQIADMSDAEREALAARVIGISTIEGRSLSAHNVCLIATQNPSATLVGGFRQWIKAGRSVRKGEHGLMIWVPMVRKDAGAGAQPGEVSTKPDSTRFICGTVFDVSQTIAVETGAMVAV